MNVPSSSACSHEPDSPTIRIGALVPLSPPGWVEAGQHLLAGLELAKQDVNAAGGIAGKPLELLVRDTAASPQTASAAVDQLAQSGVVALAGEYHSIAARAVAMRADALELPFLCSSAVLDSLVDHPTNWIARLAPAQSHGWRVYADFLLDAGHRRIAVATEPSVYWASGARILATNFNDRGGTVDEFDVRALSAPSICDALAESTATAMLLLVGHPEPAMSIVRAIRRDRRLAGVMLGAPAGQPEFAEWMAALGKEGAAIPFLRYSAQPLTPLGVRVEATLSVKLANRPSFVAFEGYDTVIVLAELLRMCAATDRARLAAVWPRVAVEGTRGPIQFERVHGISVWQWAWPPVQVVDRDPADPTRLRVLHAAASSRTDSQSSRRSHG